MTFKRCDLPTVAAHIIKRALMHRQQRDVRVLQDLTTCTVPAVTAAADASAAGTIQSEAYESADDLTDRFSNSSYQQSFPLQSSVFSLRQRRSKPDNRCRSASVRLQVNESHQYEISESQVWWHHQLQRQNENRGQHIPLAERTDALRWLLTLLIAIICGFVAVLVTSLTSIISSWKLRTFYFLVQREMSGGAFYGSAFCFLCAVNLLFALVAWAAVSIEPLAAGSGIPEVKCFLNGLNIPRLVRFRTLLCKMTGIVFAVAAGLPLGKEGPMVHAGAVIAAGVSQGKTNTFGVDTTFSKFQDFRNDREKRDFVACGAAAGIAAAFNAPIGGVLFSLEEGASFWSTNLTWRCFFCAMATVFALFLCRTASSWFGHSDSRAMFSFGAFDDEITDQSNYAVWELSLFMWVGCCGGLLGGYFNRCVTWLLRWRLVNVTGRRQLQLVEVLFVVMLMSSVAFTLPLLWGSCTPLPQPPASDSSEAWTQQQADLVAQLVPLYCEAGVEYNELASLYLTDQDSTIRQLLHLPSAALSSWALLLFFVPYVVVACITYGTAVPAGIFVPSLTAGAALGRLMGNLLHAVDHTNGTFAGTSTYALMGAAALTSGIVRMTISLTVMMLEATGDMQYVLPLMLTVMAARWVGNLFSAGINEMHIQCHGLAFLDEGHGTAQLQELHELSVQDVMSKHPQCMLPVMRVGEFLALLQQSRHHCFPVVESFASAKLVGVILRSTICTLLCKRTFGPPQSNPSREVFASPLVAWNVLESVYPRYPDVENLTTLTETDCRSWLDIRPYIDCAPFILGEHASVQRAYRMFRTLGLRHLVITNHDNQVVGIVTRSDLAATQEQPVDADSARPFTSSGSRGSKGVDAAAVTLLRDDSMRRFSPDDDFEDEAGL